jgi:hypothetical protein
MNAPAKTEISPETRKNRRGRAVFAAAALAAFAGLSTSLYTPDAEARCCWRGGWFVGGALVGAAIARPWPYYAYAAPMYYAPPVYYAPQVVYATPPSQVVYANPPVIIQPAPGIERLAEKPAPSAPAAAPAVATLSIEERLRRLQGICTQGLLDAGECQAKRTELLREM